MQDDAELILPILLAFTFQTSHCFYQWFSMGTMYCWKEILNDRKWNILNEDHKLSYITLGNWKKNIGFQVFKFLTNENALCIHIFYLLDWMLETTITHLYWMEDFSTISRLWWRLTVSEHENVVTNQNKHQSKPRVPETLKYILANNFCVLVNSSLEKHVLQL